MSETSLPEAESVMRDAADEIAAKLAFAKSQALALSVPGTQYGDVDVVLPADEGGEA